MWDLPGPGLEPVSPALVGGFLTIVPPGKPYLFLILKYSLYTEDIDHFPLRLQICLCTYNMRGNVPRPGLSIRWARGRPRNTRHTWEGASTLSLLPWQRVDQSKWWDSWHYLQAVSFFHSFIVSFSLQSLCLHSALWGMETGEMVATDAVLCMSEQLERSGNEGRVT